MRTLLEIQVQNGMVVESYSVYENAGDIFIDNVLDAEQGDPTDTMHVDPLALRPLGLALIAAADRLGTASDVHAGLVRMLSIVSMDTAGLASVAAPATAQVIPWRKIVPGAAVSERIV